MLNSLPSTSPVSMLAASIAQTAKANNQASLIELLTPEQRQKAQDEQTIVGNMVKAIEADRKSRNGLALKAAQARLQALKLAAQLAVASQDTKRARSVAHELVRLAREVASMVKDNSGSTTTDVPTPDAAAAAATASSASTPVDPAATTSQSASAEAAAVATAASSDEKLSALTEKSSGGSLDEIRAMLSVARRLILLLRQAVKPGTKEMDEIDKAGEQIAKMSALADGSTSLADSVASAGVDVVV